ncbi:Sporulation protein kinase pit1 [Sphaceloma murrayae]|uniref:Sporulation protein kinase pit1 n=1 Tax=Sphaceloma murrayae TaxID=2082308 RepID=A0A2K1QXZ8_9PEZI|nr:Sporulation protein kinase pit1 [Sphaceloma murrayae]
MTVAVDSSFRGWATHQHHNVNPAITLEDKYEIVKEIGDGSFGSVVLGRTRSAGATVVRRNTMVAIKTMKKTFDSFASCLELREVIFLKSLPPHQHLVPAYDIFLDPLSRKLHIAMEYMDGNLYQLMKARDHKPLDGGSVKSILFQILSGLEHIHEHDFFHRDIKPENILVTSSSPDTTNAFKRYSSLMTPPSTPPTYTIKLADFGLARETHSRTPYTTYVSTRWYRAPEVLLRAGEYSAPVDIWALGAMAVEIATLKPLFPGANEVDQVWRVCEIMGSPGLWVNKHGQRVGGGEWKDGVKLASKLGFSFPKMAPHSLTTVMPPSQWPASLVEFVTWCLMWDPKARPTSTQAMAHEYFNDAVDPLRPKSSSTSRLLGRKHNELPESPHSLTTKTSSWFRRSLGPREFSTPITSEQSTPTQQPLAVRPSPAQAASDIPVATTKPKPAISKRASWTHGSSSNAAPIPILPSIRPVSPLPDAATAQATSNPPTTQERPSKKLGRQLSVNSSNNHYADYHRHEAEKALSGASGLASPAGSSKESFFSHLRKRARRFSGKYGAPASPPADDVPAYGYTSNRGSMIVDPQEPEYDPASPSKDSGFAELDKVLNNVRYSLEGGKAPEVPPKQPHRTSSFNSLRRLGSLHKVTEQQAESGASKARTRRSVTYALRQEKRYETPDEEDELLDEALASAEKISRKLEKHAEAAEATNYSRPAPSQITSNAAPTSVPYLTPSPSKENNAISFGQLDAVPSSKPVDIKRTPARSNVNPQWPTPPYEENDWAATAAQSIYAAQQTHR